MQFEIHITIHKPWFKDQKMSWMVDSSRHALKLFFNMHGLIHGLLITYIQVMFWKTSKNNLYSVDIYIFCIWFCVKKNVSCECALSVIRLL